MIKIIKNNTATAIPLDIGITIPASGQVTLNVQDYDEAAASDDIVTFIGSGSITINDGSQDLNKSDGIRLIQGGYSNKIQIDDDLVNLNRIKVDVSGSLGNSQVKISENDTVAGFLEDKIVAENNKISITTLNDGSNEDIQIGVNPSNIGTSELINNAGFLTESTHDSLPFDNPHNVNKGQIGLGSVPNIDATDRTNHVGTQLASTISDFASQVAINETTTSISLTSNILTYVDEDGVSTNIDLSLYLDDTNLARIVTGSINPTTGIVTFTRDDSSTFTIDFSPLLDDQNASEVPVTPSGNLASNNVQDALVELQSDIDGLGAVDLSLQAQITSNDGDIASLVSGQSSQDSSIATNASDISTLNASQSTQDSAIALNTAKVSADGTINTHSDVDTTTVSPVTGSLLCWDGSNWIPKTIDNGFTIFPIWAEESGALSNNNRQWSFGNGATGAINITMAFDCEVFALTLDSSISGTSLSLNLMRNDGVVTTQSFTGANGVANFTAIPFTAGQRLGFQTNTEVGAYSNVRVCAWCRVPSSALFPTPDRSVVSNSAVAFTSTTFATIPGLSTTVTISANGTIDGTLIYSAARSGFTNAETQFRVVINGINGLTFSDTLSTFNDTGGASFVVPNLSAGTYTVLAQCATDQPILIASCQLTAVGVEN